MDWREATKGKEAQHWKWKYKRTVRLCKVIFNQADNINWIKYYLNRQDILGASELWNELDYEVQKLLITAPLHGGPFTTAEVKKIKELWNISTDDLEGR